MIKNLLKKKILLIILKLLIPITPIILVLLFIFLMGIGMSSGLSQSLGGGEFTEQQLDNCETNYVSEFDFERCIDDIVNPPENNSDLNESIANSEIVNVASGWVSATPWFYSGSWSHIWHPGTDIAGPIGTQIVAPTDMTIISIGIQGGGYGIYMVGLARINDEIYSFLFAHLDSTVAKVGEQVKKGQLIARMGNTGFSTGPHLHYEIIRYNSNNWDFVSRTVGSNYFVLISYGERVSRSATRLNPSTLCNLQMGTQVRAGTACVGVGGD